jgi:threonine dehydratase
MCKLTPEQRAGGVVAASAGNHGQGVALAARRLGCKAHIFMPRSTPVVKQDAVKRHGGDNVEIVSDPNAEFAVTYKLIFHDTNIISSF